MKKTLFSLCWLPVWLVLCAQDSASLREYTFSVSLSEWTPCKRINATQECYREREVVCKRDVDSSMAPWYHCEGGRPASVELCSREECVQDCIVTEWSAYSQCDCNAGLFQSRRREIIVPSVNGGTECPPLLENRTCDSCEFSIDERPRGYTWRVGEWGGCSPVAECGSGVQERAVECVDLQGDAVDVASCLEERAYSRLFPPASRQLCEVACHCNVSQWSPWSQCKPDCPSNPPRAVKTRTRVILQEPTMGLECTEPLLETQPCESSQPVLDCPVYSWETSEWSSCLFEAGGRCGVGKRQRYAYCIEHSNGTSTPVDFDKCGPFSRPSTVASCEVECSQDCVVSEWNKYTFCPLSCSAAFRNRSRNVVLPQTGVGAKCSHLGEFQACPTLPCVHWLAGDFTECILPQGFSCGNGEQSRTINCASLNGTVVDYDMCADIPMPGRSTPCRKPCPNDCVISEWSPWSQCTERCSSNVTGTQVRSRYFLAIGTNCSYSDSDLIETRECNDMNFCTQPVYYIQREDWTVCTREENISGNSSFVQLSALPSNDCELPGLQNRTSVCIRDGSVVPDSDCPIEFDSVEFRSCSLQCERDSECVFTAFTPFSPCSVSCGNGTQTRSRRLLQFPDPGMECGVDVTGMQVETLPCQQPRCQNSAWQLTDWSRCVLLGSALSQLSHPEGTTCGHGYQNRSVRCLDDAGTLVPDKFCVISANNSPKPDSFRDCVIPCPERCVVSQWSDFGDCDNGNATRSRRIVPFQGYSDWRENCPELETIVTVETHQCAVIDTSQYQWISNLHFGNCTLESPYETCGDGLEHRSIPCVKMLSYPFLENVSKDFCLAAGLPVFDSTQGCNIRCEQDCVLSEWEDWSRSPCSTSCGTGTKTRNRTVITAPHRDGLGRPCGPLTETTTCSLKACDEVEYKPGPFSACLPSNSTADCGPGTQTREALCFVNEYLQLDAARCVSSHTPLLFELERSCDLACSGECVASEWSEWSPCATNCPLPSCQRSRSRRLLRQGTNCPMLQQYGSCVPEESDFQWQALEWTDCVIGMESESSYYCGNGTQRREVECVNAVTDLPTMDRHCDGALTKPASIRSCLLPCPVDCQVGPFTDWTDCPQRCDQLQGFQMRVRPVLVQPQNGGRSCPSRIEERPCDSDFCVDYRLDLYESSCLSDYTASTVCGSVENSQPMTCLRNTEFVDVNECLLANSSEVEVRGTVNDVNCELDCPVEPVCSFTEWSDWSECMSLCANANETFEFRFRSILRSIEGHTLECLSQQYETRECEYDNMEPGLITGMESESNSTTNSSDYSTPPNITCVDFEWATVDRNGDGSNDEIQCQTSTGLQVPPSACIDSLKPRLSNDTCRTECPPDYANCNTTSGNCQCSIGFEHVATLVCLPTVFCFEDAHCLKRNTVCNRSSGRCVCQEDSRPREGGVCVPMVTTTPPPPAATTTAATPTTGDGVTMETAMTSLGTTAAATSATDAMTTGTNNETPPTSSDVGDTQTPPPGDSLGVLPIALISSLPLLVVIVTVLVLIFITHRCRKHLDKNHHRHHHDNDARSKKHREITISPPSPTHLVISPDEVRALQAINVGGGVRRGAESASSGFEDDNYDAELYKYGMAVRTFGGGAGHADTNLDIDEAVIPPDSKYLPRSPTRPYPVAVAAPTRPPYQQQQQQPSTTTTLSSSEHPSTPGHLPYESSPRQPPHHPRGAVPLSQPQQLSQGTGGGGGAGGVTGFGMGGDLTDGGIATDYTCTTDESYPPSVAPSSVGSPYNHRRHAMLLQEHDGGGGGGGGGLDPRSVASPGENPYVEMHPVYAEIKKHPYRGRGGGGGRSREHSRSRERSREMSPRLTPASPTHSFLASYPPPSRHHSVRTAAAGKDNRIATGLDSSLVQAITQMGQGGGANVGGNHTPSAASVGSRSSGRRRRRRHSAGRTRGGQYHGNRYQGSSDQYPSEYDSSHYRDHYEDRYPSHQYHSNRDQYHGNRDHYYDNHSHRDQYPSEGEYGDQYSETASPPSHYDVPSSIAVTPQTPRSFPLHHNPSSSSTPLMSRPPDPYMEEPLPPLPGVNEAYPRATPQANDTPQRLTRTVEEAYGYSSDLPTVSETQQPHDDCDDDQGYQYYPQSSSDFSPYDPLPPLPGSQEEEEKAAIMMLQAGQSHPSSSQQAFAAGAGASDASTVSPQGSPYLVRRHYHNPSPLVLHSSSVHTETTPTTSMVYSSATPRSSTTENGQNAHHAPSNSYNSSGYYGEEGSKFTAGGNLAGYGGDIETSAFVTMGDDSGVSCHRGDTPNVSTFMSGPSEMNTAVI